MEELFEFHDKVRGYQKKPNSHKQKLKLVKEKDFKRNFWQPAYATYTPLTESWAHILEDAFNAKILALPPLVNSHSQAKYTKQCRYQWNYGNSTEECIVLKDKIEELVQKGCLNDFVRGNNYNCGSYRERGRGGRKGGFRGEYFKVWGNNDQQPIREGEQRQHVNPPGAVQV